MGAPVQSQTQRVPSWSANARREFMAAVNCLRAAADLPLAPAKPIRELLRHESFEADLACALGSPLLESWPLGDQLAFLDHLSGLDAEPRSVAIYAQVYALFRQQRFSPEA